MEDTLQHALKLAAEGFWVFPCAPMAKLPAFKGWQQSATRDPQQIAAWFKNTDYNIGIFTEKFGDSESLVVLDIDVKNGKDGNAALLKLECEGRELPTTKTHNTPSGGRHLIYRSPTPVRSGVSVLGEGLDVRSDGALIVGPGSRTKDGQYGASEIGVACAPDWLVGALHLRPRERVDSAGICDVDADRARERAIRYLKDEAPPSIEGQGGNANAYKVAARVKDFGVNRDTAAGLMLENWNERCEPPWSVEEVGALVDHAYKYGNEPQGVAAPEADFEPIPEEPAEAPTKPRGLFFEMFGDVKVDTSKRPLVRGLLDFSAMSVLYGASNTGKSFLAIDMMFHIACGRPWLGHDTESGGGIYIAAEGGSGVRKRLVALRIRHKTDGQDIPLAIVPCPIDLGARGTDVEPLIKLIAEARAKMRVPVVIVVIDTLSRALAGGNENGPEDMGAFVRNVDKIRAATKSHVLIIHHTGKDKAKAARGHNSLRAATDTEIEVADNTITTTKQRDMDAAKPFGFGLQVVEVGTDDQGLPITSCVVVPRNIEAAREFGPKHIKSDSTAGRALAVFEDMWMARREGDRGIINEAWRDEFVRLHYPEKRKSGWMSFDRARASLVAARRISQEGGYVSLAS